MQVASSAFVPVAQCRWPVQLLFRWPSAGGQFSFCSGGPVQVASPDVRTGSCCRQFVRQFNITSLQKFVFFACFDFFLLFGPFGRSNAEMKVLSVETP